jgi:DamX protein
MPAYVDTDYTVGTITADRSNYWRHYGLRRDPFLPGVGVREDEFYLAPRWEQYFDLVHYLCHSSNVLMTIIGVKGSGKTTFLRHFINHFTDVMRTCQLSGSANLDVAHLLAALTKDFSLPETAGDTLDDQLDSHLANLQRCPQACLLVIDNAHRLPEETLRALLYFIRQQSESQMRLHIILLGELKLKEQLGALTDREEEQELCHHLILEPFDREEIKGYLKHRLSIAGLPAAMPFSESSVTRIHAMAEGIPGRVNAVARQTLIDAMNQRQFYSAMTFVRNRKSLFLGSGVVLSTLVLLALIISRSSHYPHAPHVPSAQVKVVSAPAPVVTPPVVIPPPIKTDIVIAPAALAAASVAAPQLNIQAAPTTHPSPATLRASRLRPPRSALPTGGEVKSSAQQTHPLPLWEVWGEDKKHQKMAKAENKIKAKPQAKVYLANNKNDHSSSNKSNNKHVLVENSGHYTVQLLGSSNPAALKTFIAKHRLGDEATYLRSTRQGKDWYTLVYGRYPTRERAQQAAQNLPKDLQSFHPWVRGLAPGATNTNAPSTQFVARKLARQMASVSSDVVVEHNL